MQTDLNFEITRATGVEAVNLAYIQTANLNISNEITRATAEEAALGQRITDEIATTALDIQTFQTAQTVHNTHIGFRVASTLNNNQVVNENTVLQFDLIPLGRRGYCLPDMSSYDTATREYIIPSDGLYVLGFHVFFNSAPTNEFRLKIVVGSIMVAVGGKFAYQTESITTTALCYAGERVSIQGGYSPNTQLIYMSDVTSWFFGYKI